MDKILDINNLIIDFESKDSTFRAVDDISFQIEKGKTQARAIASTYAVSESCG